MENNKKPSLLKKFVAIGKWSLLCVLGVMLCISAILYVKRDKIISLVVTEVNKNLTTPVNVGELSLTFWSTFPNLSVDFNRVLVHDQKKVQTDTLFYSDRIRLKLNPFDVLNKKYDVHEIEVFPGKCYLKKHKDGSVNYDIIRKNEQATANSSFQFSLENVAFHDFTIGYQDEIIVQEYLVDFEKIDLTGDFSDKQMLLSLTTKNKIRYVKSENIALIKNTPSQFDLKLIIDQINNRVTIAKTPVTIGELPFQFALESNPDQLRFNLSSNGLKITDLVNRLNHNSTKSIRSVEGSGDLKFALKFVQQNEQLPKIDASFKIKNGRIVEPNKNLTLSNIQLAGNFSNHAIQVGEKLEIENLSFQTAAGPFSGQAIVTNFSSPTILGEADGTIDLAVIHSLFALPTVESTTGKIQLSGNFDIQNTAGEMLINHCEANLNFQDVQIQQIGDQRNYKQINGELFLDGDQTKINDIRLSVGASDFEVNGAINNIQSYLKNEGNLNADLQISSVFLDIQDISHSSKKQEIADGRNYILPDDISGNIRLLTNQLVYENHTFKQLKTNLAIGSRGLKFNDLELKNSEAFITGYAHISEHSPEIFTIETEVSTDRLAFQPLFKEWDNFEQKVITADQISGHAKVNLYFKAPFDLRSGIQKKNIAAQIDLRVEEGRMRNVLAFQEITKSLKESKATRLILKQHNILQFEKELMDLKFESFENTLQIKDGQISIPNMLIASNALDVRFNGTHGFDNQIDYHFNFNFRELRQQKNITEFGEVVDDGTGLQLFVHLFGPMDSPNIRWDQEARKQLVMENIQNEKQNMKAMMKSELGLFKKDSSIAAYVPKAKPKEELIVVSAAEKTANPEITPAKKENKLNKTFNKWKQDAESTKKQSTSTEGF